MIDRKYFAILSFYFLIIAGSAFAYDTAQNNNKGFYNQRYKGWFWFEEKEKPNKKSHNNKITSEEAQKEIEDLKAHLDSKRNIMIARPSPETVRDYMYYEQIMWEKALALDSAYRKAKFLYPDYYDKIKDPLNVHAVKFKRKLDQQALEQRVKDFAIRFNLVFFSKGSCHFCHEFAPILKRFSDYYGFNTEEASLDGVMTGVFNGRKVLNLASKLGIEATPTLVVVSKDGKIAFELIRGFVTISELEEYVGLAIDYIKTTKTRFNLIAGDKDEYN